jgi:hypothetical protein
VPFLSVAVRFLPEAEVLLSVASLSFDRKRNRCPGPVARGALRNDREDGGEVSQDGLCVSSERF